MTRKTLVALKRADCAIAFAFFLVLVTASGAIAYNPHTDNIAARAAPVVSMDLAPPTEVAAAPMKPLAGAPSPAELEMVKMWAEQNCLAQAMYTKPRADGHGGAEAGPKGISNHRG